MYMVSRSHVSSRVRGCIVCPVPIEKDEVYRKYVSFDGGEVFEFICCLACDEASHRSINDGYEDLDGCSSPDTIQAWAWENHHKDPIAKILYDKFDHSED